MKKLIKFSLLVLIVSNASATMMPKKLAKERKNNFKNMLTIDFLLEIHEYEREVSKKIGREIENIVRKEVNMDNKVWDEQQARFFAQSDERMKEVDNCLPGADLKKMLEASHRRQKEREGELLYWKDIRAKRLARVNKELGLAKKQIQKQGYVPKQESELVLGETEIESIMYRDNLATFKRVAWENISMTKDEMLKKVCMYDSPKIALHIIKGGANVNYRDKVGNIPLHWAVIIQNTKVAKVLIEEGINVNQRNNLGRTPLYDVLDTGDVSLAKLFIKAGADVNCKDNSNMTALEHGLWLNTLKSLSSKGKERRLKVINYIRSVIEEKKRLNRAGIIGAGEDLDIYPV